MAFTPFQPNAETHIQRGKLPHWRQWGVTYFVTARLADSVPAAVAADWRRRRDAWMCAHGIRTADELLKLTEAQRHEYHREFTSIFHELLDAGHGECVLAKPACAELLRARLTAGHATAYHLDAWCIMPNHLHALVEPAAKATRAKVPAKPKAAPKSKAKSAALADTETASTAQSGDEEGGDGPLRGGWWQRTFG